MAAKAKSNNKACELNPIVFSNEQINAKPKLVSRTINVSLKKLERSGVRIKKRVTRLHCHGARSGG